MATSIRVLGGSATGTSHVTGEIGCQDSHAWYLSDGVGCFAVADGAGSRPRSAEGSAIVVEAVCAFVRDASEQPDEVDNARTWPSVADLFEQARLRLEEHALAEATTVDTFSTTLAVVIVVDGHIEVGQVGDSIVVIRGSDGSLRSATPGERFEYANETVFLSNGGWRNHLRLDRFEADEVSAIALSTDGLRFKILDDLAAVHPYEPFFEDVFGWLESATATSEAVARFIDRLDDQSGDDKTLVVAGQLFHDVPPRTEFVVNQYFAESSAPMAGGGEMAEAAGSADLSAHAAGGDASVAAAPSADSSSPVVGGQAAGSATPAGGPLNGVDESVV